MEDRNKEAAVFMWGYLPGASPEKSPLLSPTPIRLPTAVHGGDSWKDICSGGCGFAMAISESGKLVTWGSTEEEGQSYMASGQHGETPEPILFPGEARVVKAVASWAQCVALIETGDVYTWGWKECVPSGKLTRDSVNGGFFQKEPGGKQSVSVEQVNSRSRGQEISGLSQSENRREALVKRRRIASAKEESEALTSGDDYFTVSPFLVSFCRRVRITSVAAGGRHMLALSDTGYVWGWGYGGEGQLGVGSRIKMVSSPHPIPCIEPLAPGNDRSLASHRGSMNSLAQPFKVPGSYIKAIACGGRHSAVLTDAGAILTFGWGLHGQCGQGSSNDQLRPTYVSSLSNVQVECLAAGLWHTLCISDKGRVYAFGGNQFGQLGTGTDHGETIPRLLDAPSVESQRAKIVSCGARHSVILSEDDVLLCWGWNKYGQLGLGDTIDRNIPSQVQLDSCIPKSVACGWWHTLMLAEVPA